MPKKYLILTACITLSACNGGGNGNAPPNPAINPATNHYYTGAASATSNVAGLYSVNSDSPAVPATVDGNALAFVRSVDTGTLDTSTGTVSNYRQHAVVFASGGRLYRQYADQAPAPAQISNVTTISAGVGNGAAGSSATDLCYLNTMMDLAAPDNSVVIYGQAGTDATCGNTDDTSFWLRLNTSTSTAPSALAVLPVAPVYSSAGAITNFLVINGSGALVKLDANFGGATTTIAAGPFAVTANDKDIWVAHLSPTRIVVHLPPAGSLGPSGELRIVDVGANSITGALGTIANRTAWGYNHVNDSSNFYFVGNDAAGDYTGIIQRFPVNGSAAATTFVNAGAVRIDTLWFTPNSVVYSTDTGTGTTSIAAVPRIGGAPVSLATGTAGESVSFYVVSNTGYVYFNRVSSTLSAWRAQAVKDDGTGLVSHGAANGAEWSSFQFPTTYNAYSGEFYAEKTVVAEFSAAASSIAGATLSVVDGGTAAKNGIVVGTVPAGIQYLFGGSFGPRALWSGFDGDGEVFYADTTVVNSLTRVTTDTVQQDPVE